MTLVKSNLYFLALIFLCFNPLTATAEEAHDHAGNDHDHEQVLDHVEEPDHEEGHDHGRAGDAHEDENRVHLNEAQRLSAGIVVEALVARPLTAEIQAPGEIRLNTYATSQVTPRIEAQVVERHARLGGTVKPGDRLVTLSSVAIAETQGVLLVAGQEWQRVKKLGRKVVSERRYQESQIAFQQARARLLAYGMSQAQLDQLIRENNIGQANGLFTLLSPQAGTIIRDDFITGQMVQPGELLFEITDESRLWVEARVDPKSVSHIHSGASARVLAGKQWIDGHVIQVHHALDETTRTLAVRLEIPNPGDHLHAGQFVKVRIQTGENGSHALTLPLDAVMRSPDGDWQVFVEELPGEFEPREVELVRQLPGLAVIDGLAPGTRVVTQGAFFVQSELAKSGFDVHNH